VLGGVALARVLAAVAAGTPAPVPWPATAASVTPLIPPPPACPVQEYQRDSVRDACVFVPAIGVSATQPHPLPPALSALDMKRMFARANQLRHKHRALHLLGGNAEQEAEASTCGVMCGGCAQAVLLCAASAYGMLSAFLSHPRSQLGQHVIRAASS